MTKTAFFAEVYAIVARIPAGRVMTYGQIARIAAHPRSARRVGLAMSAAPSFLELPCHRVVNRLGQMAPGGAFGGEGRQREMLEQEKAPFHGDGRVDMAHALWDPPDTVF